MKHLVQVFSIVSLCVAVGGSAAVLEVPSTHQTINEAIDAAVDGDTVRVAPGTYRENVDFSGKNIVLTSHYEAKGDWGLVETTVIDGGSPSDPAAASTVVFQSGEDRNAVLQGFTITGGSGTEWVDPQFPAYTWRGGGGVFIFQASPTLRYNIIKENTVENGDTVDGAQGGGLLCFGGNPLIHNTVITHNQAESGGGLVVDYSGAVVRNTVISHNIGGQSYGGGGVWTIGAGNDPIVFENTAVVYNSSPTKGGAFYVWNSTVSARNSIVWGNDQTVGGQVSTTIGGQMHITHSDVQGGFSGTGNIDADPLFADPETYELSVASPAVDAGDPDAAFSDPEDGSEPGQAAAPALGGLRNDMGAYGGPGAAFLSPQPAPDVQAWLVPAVVHAPGALGTEWRTSVNVVNVGAEEVDVHLELVTVDERLSRNVALGAGASIEWVDVVVDLFDGLDIDSKAGTLLVTTTGSLLITSRVFNQASSGTFGQYMLALSKAHCIGQGATGYLLHLKGNDEFRSNLGLANTSANDGMVRIQLFDAQGNPIGTDLALTVSGGRWSQVNDLFAATQAGTHGLAYATVDVLTDVSVWAYASVVDAETGDATTIPLLQR